MVDFRIFKKTYMCALAAMAENAMEIHPGAPNIYFVQSIAKGEETRPIFEKADVVVEDDLVETIVIFTANRRASGLSPIGIETGWPASIWTVGATPWLLTRSVWPRGEAQSVGSPREPAQCLSH